MNYVIETENTQVLQGYEAVLSFAAKHFASEDRPGARLVVGTGTRENPGHVGVILARPRKNDPNKGGSPGTDDHGEYEGAGGKELFWVDENGIAGERELVSIEKESVKRFLETRVEVVPSHWGTSCREASSGSNSLTPFRPADVLCCAESHHKDSEDAAVASKAATSTAATKQLTTREKLVAVFTAKAPLRLSSIDKILLKYAGREHELLKKMEDKYGDLTQYYPKTDAPVAPASPTAVASSTPISSATAGADSNAPAALALSSTPPLEAMTDKAAPAAALLTLKDEDAYIAAKEHAEKLRQTHQLGHRKKKKWDHDVKDLSRIAKLDKTDVPVVSSKPPLAPSSPGRHDGDDADNDKDNGGKLEQVRLRMHNFYRTTTTLATKALEAMKREAVSALSRVAALSGVQKDPKAWVEVETMRKAVMAKMGSIAREFRTATLLADARIEMMDKRLELGSAAALR